MTPQIRIQDGQGSTPTISWTVASGAAATIGSGVPTKAGSAGAIVPMVDGDGTTSQRFTGVAKSVSTDTASAAGVCTTFLPLPAIMYAGKAKSAAAANTQSEIDALLYKRVIFDLTAGAWTVDTAENDAATNGVIIVGGEYQTSTIYFMVAVDCSFLL